MKYTIIMRRALLLITIVTVTMYSCKNEAFDEHYNSAPERVNAKMWDAIQDSARFSLFVQYMKDAGLDTTLAKSQSLTLFIPSNELFKEFSVSGKNLYDVMAYHISPTVLVSNNIGASRQLETLTGKFGLLEKNSDGLYYDGIKIIKSSPLFMDGNFYELSSVAYPNPNLYEYTEKFSQVINTYIKSRDLKILDLEKSTPLYFNENGKTVYDSVYTELNYLDLEYFSTTSLPLLEVEKFEDFKSLVDGNSDKLQLVNMPYFEFNGEFRDYTSTFLLFTQDQYNEALDVVADNLGSGFNDRRDIPLDWQEEVVMPYFFDRGLFPGTLDYSDFFVKRLNVKGDSVLINWENVDPASRVQCSNGATYNYLDFEIPKSLYVDTLKAEGEDLIEPVGDGENYKWRTDIPLTVSDVTWKPNGPITDVFFSPISESDNAAPGEALLVNFVRSFRGPFSIEFTIPKVFPRNYKLRFQSKKMSVTGLIGVYFNGRYLGNTDTYKYNRPIVDEDGKRNLPFGAKRDINYMQWNVSTENYADAVIKVVYEDKGQWSSGNGLVMDFVGLYPVIEE